jgi:hypothetical protein
MNRRYFLCFKIIAFIFFFWSCICWAQKEENEGTYKEKIIIKGKVGNKEDQLGWKFYFLKDEPTEFVGVSSFTVNKEENIYILDNLNNRIQIFDSTGKHIAQWPFPKEFCKKNGGYSTSARDIGVDDSGNVYVLADPGEEPMSIYIYNSNGKLTRKTKLKASPTKDKFYNIGSTFMSVGPEGNICLLVTAYDKSPKYDFEMALGTSSFCVKINSKGEIIEKTDIWTGWQSWVRTYGKYRQNDTIIKTLPNTVRRIYNEYNELVYDSLQNESINFARIDKKNNLYFYYYTDNGDTVISNKTYEWEDRLLLKINSKGKVLNRMSIRKNMTDETFEEDDMRVDREGNIYFLDGGLDEFILVKYEYIQN